MTNEEYEKIWAVNERIKLVLDLPKGHISDYSRTFLENAFKILNPMVEQYEKDVKELYEAYVENQFDELCDKNDSGTY